jgi:ATP-dependent Clp protease ATP-binding subunit ClpA
VQRRPGALKKSVTAYLDGELQSLVTDDDDDAKPTAGFQRVIQRAVIHVQSSGPRGVTGANVLVAIFSERESHAAYFLQEQDMTRYDAVNYIAHGIAKKAGASKRAREGRRGGRGQAEREAGLRGPRSLLREPQREGQAGEGRPLIGRAHEVERCIQVLCRRTKNNPLLVGDPGVGKTAIAEGPGAQDRPPTTCPRCWKAPPSSRSTWARCWPAPATAATSRSG